MKTNKQAALVAEGSLAQVISISALKARQQKQRLDSIMALAHEMAEERTGLPQPWTRDQLIARFRAESEGKPAYRKDIVLRADVRPGMVVGMTREQSARFDRGEMAEVIALKKG